jgi:hypothetical protein
MPICRNDKNKSYKGTEPSPKGLGWCAHNEKIGTIKKGKNNKMWIVKKVSSGSKRWIKHSGSNKKYISTDNDEKIDCKKFRTYIKKENSLFGKKIKKIMGIEVKHRHIRKFISFNKFSNDITKVPSEYKKIKISKWNLENYCKSGVKLLKKNNDMFKQIKHGGKVYFIHDNRERPFIVYVINNTVYIYKKPIDAYHIPDLSYTYTSKDKWMYVQFIKQYKYKQIWIANNYNIDNIGKYDPKLNIFKDKYFIGNSILLKLNTNDYLYIGDNIYKFKTQNDIIIDFYSPVGRNDVPYPVAIGNNNIYFLLDKKYVSVNKFIKLDKKMKIHAYSYFYGYEGDEALKKYAKSIKHVKNIQKRIL